MSDLSPMLRTGVTPLVANAGIRLCMSDGRCHAIPQARNPVRVIPLPRLPASYLERVAGFSRCFWRRYRRCLSVLLFLDIDRCHWVTRVPPQACGEADTRWDATFDAVSLGRSPGANLRLAGSVRTAPGVTAHCAPTLAPAFDGIHILLDPRGWVLPHFVLCTAGIHVGVPAESVIGDHYDSQLDHFIEGWAIPTEL